MISDKKFAFIELAKYFLGMNHIPGESSGFNPPYEDTVVCFDLILNFPDYFIQKYCGPHPVRHLAHAVVNQYYERGNVLVYAISASTKSSASTTADDYDLCVKIIDFIVKWKEEYGAGE